MGETIYLLRIELDAIKPKIWREFFVPAKIRLPDLHYVIQLVMGWKNAHLHEFVINRTRYQESPDPEFPAEDAFAYRLIDLVPTKTKVIKYIYDFGDSWKHVLKFLKADFSPPDGFPNRVGCLRGARACPPEDIGGPFFYQDFLDALKSPDNPEHAEMKQWYADFFDPESPFDSESFDSAEVNKFLAQIKL